MVQLSDLLEAGCPLSRALDACARQAPGKPLGKVAAHLHGEINNGASLAGAMESLRPHFSETQISMVRAAEAGGFLQKTLSRLAAHAAQQTAAVKQIRAKLAYPAVLALTAIASVVFLLTYVVPRFTRMYRTAQQLLPTPTRVLLAVSNFIADQWIAVILATVAMLLILRAIFRWSRFKDKWDSVAPSIPVIGPVIRNWEMARFARTMALMLAGGGTVPRSLRISGRVISNRAFRQEVDELASAVEHGQPLSGQMHNSRFFDVPAIEMIVISETTGKLAVVMGRLGEQRYRDFQLRVDTLLSLLEPAIILIVGCLVGLTVVALLLPVLLMNTLIVG